MPVVRPCVQVVIWFLSWTMVWPGNGLIRNDSVGVISAAEPRGKLVMRLASGSTSVFGNTAESYELEVVSREPWSGLVQVAHAAGHRTLGRIEFAVELRPDTPRILKFEWPMPSVDVLVVQKTTLECRCVDVKAAQTEAAFEQDVYVFPREAFAGRQRWARRQMLRVFDPVGNTTRVLKRSGLPFEPVRGLDGLKSLGQGTLIVGEGADFRRLAALDQILAELPRRGVSVLCLAPKSATLPVVFGDPTQPAGPGDQVGLQFRKADIIRELDPRLVTESLVAIDADAANDPRGQPSRIHIVSERGRVVARMNREGAHGANGWPWLRVDYAQKSSLVFCGFELIKDWERGPVPRYLLLRILEELSRSDESPGR